MKKKKILSMLLALMLTFSIVAYGAYDSKLSVDKITVENVYNPTTTTPGTITLAADTLVTGNSVTIKLGTETLYTKTIEATTDTTTATVIDVTTLTKKKGTLKVTVTSPGSTTVKEDISKAFDAQKSPVVTPTAISVQGYSDIDDVLTVTDDSILVDDIITVYPSTASDKLVTDSTKSTTAEKALVKSKKATVAGTISVNLGKRNITSTTGIKVSITHKDCTESDKATVTAASGATFIEATKTTTASAIAVPGGVLVYGLSTTGKEKITATVYSANPYTLATESDRLGKYIISGTSGNKTALENITLGKAASVTNAKASYIFIPFSGSKLAANKVDLKAGDKVYVVFKYNGTAKDKKDYKANSDAVEVVVK